MDTHLWPDVKCLKSPLKPREWVEDDTEYDGEPLALLAQPGTVPEPGTGALPARTQLPQMKE